jgi:hypothetical protein
MLLGCHPANKPGKAELLTQAGVDAVTTGLDEITTALHLAPRPCLAIRQQRRDRCPSVDVPRQAPVLAQVNK